MKIPKFYEYTDFYVFGIMGSWNIYWDKKPIREVIADWKARGLHVFSKHNLGFCNCCDVYPKTQFWIYNLGIEIL